MWQSVSLFPWQHCGQAVDFYKDSLIAHKTIGVFFSAAGWGMSTVVPTSAQYHPFSKYSRIPRGARVNFMYGHDWTTGAQIFGHILFRMFL